MNAVNVLCSLDSLSFNRWQHVAASGQTSDTGTMVYLTSPAQPATANPTQPYTYCLFPPENSYWRSIDSLAVCVENLQQNNVLFV